MTTNTLGPRLALGFDLRMYVLDPQIVNAPAPAIIWRAWPVVANVESLRGKPLGAGDPLAQPTVFTPVMIFRGTGEQAFSEVRVQGDARIVAETPIPAPKAPTSGHVRWNEYDQAWETMTAKGRTWKRCAIPATLYKTPLF